MQISRIRLSHPAVLIATQPKRLGALSLAARKRRALHLEPLLPDETRLRGQDQGRAAPSAIVRVAENRVPTRRPYQSKAMPPSRTSAPSTTKPAMYDPVLR